MNTRNLPGFAGEASLYKSKPYYLVPKRSGGHNVGGDRVITPAESVPGGPSTVPSGYGRTCRRVPYTVCDSHNCRTEYGWICTYYPLPPARGTRPETHHFATNALRA